MTNFLSGEQAGTAPHKEDVGRGGGDHLDFQDELKFSSVSRKDLRTVPSTKFTCSVKILKRRFLRDSLDELIKT